MKGGEEGQHEGGVGGETGWVNHRYRGGGEERWVRKKQEKEKNIIKLTQKKIKDTNIPP